MCEGWGGALGVSKGSDEGSEEGSRWAVSCGSNKGAMGDVVSSGSQKWDRKRVNGGLWLG